MFSSVIVEISAAAFALLPDEQNSGFEGHSNVQDCTSHCFGRDRVERTTNHRTRFLEEKLKDMNVSVIVMSDNSGFTASSMKLCGGWSEICAVRIWLMHYIQTASHMQHVSVTEQLEAGTRSEVAVSEHCTESPSLDTPRRSLRNRNLAKQDHNVKAVLLSTLPSSKPIKAKRLRQNNTQTKVSNVLLANVVTPERKRDGPDTSEEMLESYNNDNIRNDEANVSNIVECVDILTDKQFAAEKLVTGNDDGTNIQTFHVESPSRMSDAQNELSHQRKELLGVNKSAQKLTFRCDLCDYVTGKHRNLLMHVARKHGDRSYICPTCNRTFAIAKDLNQHLKCHTEQYCCEHCGRTLKSKYAVTMHVARVHKGVAPWPVKRYLCTLCGKMCRNKTDYSVHRNKEHTGVRPFHCDICNADFFSRCNLRAHRQVTFSFNCRTLHFVDCCISR